MWRGVADAAREVIDACAILHTERSDSPKLCASRECDLVRVLMWRGVAGAASVMRAPSCLKL
jgi:hypothetical protein